MAGNFVAGDGEHQRLRVSFPRNSDLDDGALGALEHVGDIAGGQTIGGLVVNLHDDVAGTNAGVVGGCADVGSHDDGVVVARGGDQAGAVVLAAAVFAEGGEWAGVQAT